MDTYEKKYKEALSRAKEQLEGAKVFDYKEGQIAHDIRTTTYAIFPELAESEDERIRKELIFYLGDMPEDTELRNGVTNRDVLVWLEKQGKQKPYWSEEDESICNNIIYDIANDKSICKYEISKRICDLQINWLKSLKDRVQHL